MEIQSKKGREFLTEVKAMEYRDFLRGYGLPANVELHETKKYLIGDEV